MSEIKENGNVQLRGTDLRLWLSTERGTMTVSQIDANLTRLSPTDGDASVPTPLCRRPGAPDRPSLVHPNVGRTRAFNVLKAPLSKRRGASVRRDARSPLMHRSLRGPFLDGIYHAGIKFIKWSKPI